MRSIRDDASRRSAGFTLIELLIVVAIIGILVAAGTPSLLNAIERARQVSTSTLLRDYGTAIGSYYVDEDFFPTAANIDELTGYLFLYSEGLDPTDAWYHPLGFSSNGTHYTVESYGKDGIDGADVSPATRTIFTLDIVYSDGAFRAGID